MENKSNEPQLADAHNHQLSESDDGTHLRELKTGGTILQWQREIYKLLEGERKSKITSTYGSVSDYIESLIISSTDRTSARLYFAEALNRVVSDNTFSTCSPYQVDTLLTLIVSFKPPKGFAEVANFLREGGTFESQYHPIGSYVPIDLHEKSLVALRAFYRVAPQDATEPAFRTYAGILNQHLHYASYCGFAAKELIKLELLRPGTAEMRNIIIEHLESLEILIPFLASEERRLYAKDDLKNLIVDCVEIQSSEPFKKFTEVLQKISAKIRYADDLQNNAEFSEKNLPFAIDFLNGTSYGFGLSDKESKTFAKYMSEINQDDLTRTVELIVGKDYSSTQKTDGLSAYFYRSVGLSDKSTELFVQKLETIDAKVVLRDPEKISIKRGNSAIDLHYEKEQVEKFRIWELMNLKSHDRLDRVATKHEQYFNTSH